MSISFLDPYHHRPSLIHGLDARVKLPLTLAFILSIALTRQGAWPAFILLAALLLSAELASEVGVRYYLSRSLIALPFALAALPVLFTLPGSEIARLPFDLTITAPGLTRFTSILLKSWLSIQAALVLTATTPFPGLLAAMRSLRIPRLLVSIFSLMWRYLFVMAAEVQRMLRARASRSASLPGRPSGGTLVWRARGTGAMAGTLFLRSLDRSDRIYSAMLARGYDGEVRTLPLPALSGLSWIVLTAGLLILGLILSLNALL